jgi:hypothetical protein
MSHSTWRDKKKVRKDAAPLILIYPTNNSPEDFYSAVGSCTVKDKYPTKGRSS